MQELKLECDGNKLMLTCRDGTIKTGRRICIHKVDIADIFVLVDIELLLPHRHRGDPVYVMLGFYTSYNSQDDSKYIDISLDNLDTFPDIYQKCMEEVMSSLSQRIKNTQEALLILRGEIK